MDQFLQPLETAVKRNTGKPKFSPSVQHKYVGFCSRSGCNNLTEVIINWVLPCFCDGQRYVRKCKVRVFRNPGILKVHGATPASSLYDGIAR